MAISHPQPKSLEEIIISKKYKVPLYQRSYSWEIDQVSELWDDILRNNPPYFLGILMLRVLDGKDLFEVVDGQQRLATLLLLLRAAAEVIELQDIKIAEKINQKYIHQERGLKKTPELTLSLNRQDKEKFESLLLGKSLMVDKKYESWKRIDNTMKFFREKLEEILKNKGLDNIISIIDEKVLALSFLDVEVEKDSDVYLFFETLNDRGMDLSIADLVKNRVCAVMAKPGELPEEAASKMDEISEKIGSGNMKNFLLHYCWSKADEKEPTPRKGLMDWFYKTIQREKSKFLSDLEKNSLIYSGFMDPRKNVSDVKKKQALFYLKLLNATRCYPLLLQGENVLALKDFLRLCKAVEILTFRYNTILNKDAKPLESLYYNAAERLKKGSKVGHILDDLKKEAKNISDKLFFPAFSEFSPINHQLARYILLKIEEYNTLKSASLDWDSLTLEHILAQGLKWEGRDQYLNRLGNYTLLSSRLNSDIGNKEFRKKKLEFKKEKHIQITKGLLKYKDFTKDTIMKRQDKFATIAIEIWNPDLIK